MPFFISPYLPFPPLLWWIDAMQAGAVMLDGHEHLVKATARNRYRIAGANGVLLLSIPLQGGRGQRSAVKEVLVDNSVDWQKQHWRSILSAYGRAPYFEHYAPELAGLFEKKYKYLVDFSSESIQWLCKNAATPLQIGTSLSYLTTYPEAIKDWRFGNARLLSMPADNLPAYPQVFDTVNGFHSNLSLLDLLMNEGPAAQLYLATAGK